MREDRRGPGRVRRPRILVVDDSSTIRRILAGRLAKAGYDVAEAVNGRAGLKACRAEPPDLVLLDVDMPELDGRATLTEMKADPALERIPVLFLTAHSGGEDVASGLELGAQDYLRKPCEPAELLARVSTALRMDQMRRQLEQQAVELDALSNTDPLTGVGNRRKFEQYLPSLVVDTRGKPIGFLLMDIDHFKQINDTHGHVIGDATLRIIAERLRRLVADDCSVYRWGGEEFVVLAPGLDGDAVAALAETVRAALSNTAFAIDDLLIPVTVSIGCVSAPASRWESAINAADAAMYEAKQSGRNAARSRTL